ncbi:type II CRISPR RNA-guided endonuclease Cas9 [Rhodoferax sp.]|uniref:type II CRISPR RNA-guided endonuclease Cas9 n=1 Tax=Rhodoferax sp. TaxID=50421 RepID=UPI0025EF8D88|nr:type II CRISPR RNA-guided endonuclease Cas9 [Rhodoferax sp.]MCM2295312.1 type II CRISPR RNA-guided endonuclease Cas9 [Rhodoferax sp.]
MDVEQDKTTDKPADLIFGLDIGIASVGWAVLNSTRIVDLGVRCFDKAETAKEGESLNLARRTARLLRRRLYRRAWRLTKLTRLFKKEGLVQSADYFKQQPGFTDSAWLLRVVGLDRLLTPSEWARVIYHLCKHRGFHWVSKAEEISAEADAKSESGKVKKGLAHTQALMQTKGYRTAAEMVLSEFPEAQRNKRGDYSKALSRRILDQELEKLFQAQRRLGSTHADIDFELLIRGNGDCKSGLFWKQKPALAGNDLLKMLGKCTFEKTEYRAPKASFTAERHVWLTRLNNLRVIVDGVSRPLNETEHRAARLLPYQSGEKFTYTTLRNALTRSGLLPVSFRFGGLSYPSDRQKEEDKAKNPEDQILVKLTAWHELRLALNKADLADVWQQISVAALEGQPETLDQIAWVLSVYKDDEEVHAELENIALPQAEKTMAVLLGIRFDKFHALSLKALRQIVPHMERGLRYDEAVELIPEYGHHSQQVELGTGQHKYLPPFYADRDKRNTMIFREDLDVPRNPVVLRALNQTRKVVNALIKTYGSPMAVHIEMARDLSRPLDERRDIEKLQKEYKDRNEKAREDFEKDFGYRPKASVFEKWMLYREQQCKCAYSLEAMDIGRILDDPNYAQVDHALPYSRSFDDSKNNKVLVLSRENQNKGNRTAFEYLTSFTGGEEGERWRNFVAWVNGNKAYRAAKRNRLLRKNYGTEEAAGFRDRNLNDTRYICRFFKNYVEEHLQLAQDANGNKSRRCVVVNGQLTAFLRMRWGLSKVREESDRHHALDAAVVAACSHGMVKALADYSRRKEIALLHEGIPDPETGEIINPTAHERLAIHFPEPWPHFRHELEARRKTDDITLLREQITQFGTYSAQDLQQMRTLFVSRAPQRRNGGAVHKDTIYAQSESQIAKGSVVQKVPLTSLSTKDLDNLADPHRNAKLYAAIRERLDAYGGKADKAFGPDKPFYKPGKDGQPAGPVVRTVKLVIDKLSGIPIRGGIAKNDSMIRVDVFNKTGKFHLVPVYVHHRVTGLPNRAIVAYKDETEWTLIDKSFIFLFSIYPNDLVRVSLKKESRIGYYASCNRSTGAIDLWAHDRANSIGKDGLIQSIGVKTAYSVEKFNVDLLGHIYPAAPEIRRGLA